jgi:hypothetical protein
MFLAKGRAHMDEWKGRDDFCGSCGEPGYSCERCGVCGECCECQESEEEDERLRYGTNANLRLLPGL